MFLGAWKKLENPDRTYKDTGRTICEQISQRKVPGQIQTHNLLPTWAAAMLTLVPTIALQHLALKQTNGTRTTVYFSLRLTNMQPNSPNQESVALPRENRRFPGETDGGWMPPHPTPIPLCPLWPAPLHHSLPPVVLLTPPAARHDRDLSPALWLTQGRIHAVGSWWGGVGWGL